MSESLGRAAAPYRRRRASSPASTWVSSWRPPAGDSDNRRLAMAAGSAGVIAAIVVGSLAFRSDPSAEPDPAPSPSPSPSPSVAVDPINDGTRPLVYAAGSTVHVGDETFDAGAVVGFLDVTDDGVVFVTEDEQDVVPRRHDDCQADRSRGQVRLATSTSCPRTW